MNEKKLNPRKVGRLVLIFIFLIGYYFFTRYTGYGIPCVFRMLTHLKCPGCGTTHLFLALGRGRLKEAFFSNPAVFISLPFLLFELFRYLQKDLYDQRFVPHRIEKTGLLLLAGFLCLFGIVRNLPVL